LPFCQHRLANTAHSPVARSTILVPLDCHPAGRPVAPTKPSALHTLFAAELLVSPGREEPSPAQALPVTPQSRCKSLKMSSFVPEESFASFSGVNGAPHLMYYFG